MSSNTKPTINVTNGELHTVVDEAERVLSEDNRYKHFAMGGQIVELHVSSETDAVTTRPLSQHAASYKLSQSAKWVRPKADDEAITIDPPAKHIAVLIDRNDFKYLKPLDGIAHQPFIKPDGSLCCVSGYDTSTRIYCNFKSDLYTIPEKPTKQHAEEALARLCELLAEFEFKTDYDRSAALCFLLTAVTRVSLKHAPLLFVSAFVPGSGKSFLTKIVAKFASPSDSKKLPFPSTDDECLKLLVSTLRESPGVIEFDNLTADIKPYPSLCTALTSQTISGRVLGESKMLELPTRALFTASGNNVSPIADLARRTLTSRLAPASDTPENREFFGDPEKLLNEKRETYVAYALTIIRAYIEDDSPCVEATPVTGFDDWSELCRQPLMWLNQPDPCITMFETARDNPERKRTRVIIDLLDVELLGKSFTVRQIVEQGSADLKDLLAEIASDDGATLNNRKLGWWLRSKTGHTGTDKRLVSVESNRNSKWAIEHTATTADAYAEQSNGI